MSETIREQIEYGTACVHGRPVGTPGGADLMCQDCEDGADTWINDPTFRLMFFVDGAEIPLPTKVTWRRTGATAATKRVAELVTELHETAFSDWPVVWQAEQESEGYWI